MAGLCRASDEADTLDAVLDLLLAALDDEDAAVAGRAEDFLLWLGAGRRARRRATPSGTAPPTGSSGCSDRSAAPRRSSR